MSRWPCKDYFRGTSNNSFCEKWHPPECLFYKTKSGCRFGEKCSYAHRQVDEQPTKRSKTNDDKSAVAMLKKNDWHENVWQLVINRDKNHERSERPDINRDTCHELKRGPVGCRSWNAWQLGYVFQDMKPPKPILRKSSDMQKPIQRVKFTKAIARHSKIRDQNPPLGYICPGEPNQRSPNAPKFEDRLARARFPRSSVEAGQKCIKIKKEQERATFFRPSENRRLPASTLKPEEREFVVDSRASMHIISKKDLSDAEMDTLTKSCSPTIDITANGEVQTHEEAIVYVKEVDIFLTLKSPRKHASSIVARKALRWKRIFSWMDQWSKTTSHEKTGFGYPATRRTSFLLWFQACNIRPLDRHRPQGHLRDRRVIPQHLLQPRLLHLHQVIPRLENERIELKVTSLQ